MAQHFFLKKEYLFLVLLGIGMSWSCQGDRSGLMSGGSVLVSYEAGLGYTFSANDSQITCQGGRGLIFLPEDGVSLEAYASYARDLVAKSASYVVVLLETPSELLVFKAMKKESWQVSYWAFAGHGKGGRVATDLITTIEPKVRSLVLIGTPLPDGVDLRARNILVALVAVGGNTSIPPESVTDSLSRMPGDATFWSFPDLDYHLSRINWTESRSLSQLSTLSSTDFDSRSQMLQVLTEALGTAHWPVATTRALSFGDNGKLTPGQNDSKPYPGHIRVHFAEVPIPETLPQRLWSVFTPTEVQGGLVYYPGAAVDYRAYWPLAFEIAARGYLVVVVQQPGRNAPSSFTDATTVLDSNLDIFSKVPKTRWAVAGHSAGGLGASMYAASYPKKIFAVVLHAGALAQNMSDSTLPLAQIYGTLDNVFGGYERYKEIVYPFANLATTEFITISRGNHGQVGDYGFQICDQVATIGLDDQQKKLAEATVKFLDTYSKSNQHKYSN